jgi:hypothetical protein
VNQDTGEEYGMDTQVIVAIITGLFGAMITPLTTQVIIPALTNRKKDSPMESKPERSLPTFLHAGVGGVSGVLLGYFLISSMFVSPCPPFAPTRVNITSPVSGTSVSQVVPVQGTACHPNGRELWLLVVPEGVTGYYPQRSGPVVIPSDGNWSTSAQAGLNNPNDIGRGFVLNAALADQQGGAAIRTYFAKSGPGFGALESLPQGVQVMAQVRVIRK